jgi:hypothetical protein
VAGESRWRHVASRMGARAVMVVTADGRQLATPTLAARLLPPPAGATA